MQHFHIDEEIRFTGAAPDAEFEEEAEAEEISPTDDPVRLYLRDPLHYLKMALKQTLCLYRQ